jgi:Asp-tRNA(Asn)/Glu-tRNA(Gln) amidotransferase A subunit family amidase
MARRILVALLLTIIAGHDRADPGSAGMPTDDYTANLDAGVDGWRLGVIGDEWLGDVEPDVRASVRAAVGVLASAGALVEELAAPDLLDAGRLNGLMTTADAATFHRERLERSPEDFGEDVLARLRRGAAYGATDYADARRRRPFFGTRSRHGSSSMADASTR